MGKGQSTIANKMRLLTLTNEVQVALMNNLISERHARCLLQIKDEDKQKEVLNKVIAERMNVRDTDNYIKNMLGLPNDNPTNSNISQVEVPNKPSLDFDIPKPVESNEPNINEPSSSEIEIPSFDNEKEEKPTSNSGEANLSVPIETKKQEENPNVYAQTNNVDFVNISSLNNDTEESQKLETPVVPTNDKQEDIDILERLRNEDDISGESEPKSMNNFELPNIDNNIQSNNLENSTDLSKIKLATAIKLTKDTIEVIKDAGYEVSLKETDNDKEYILTITVQK